MESKSSSEAEMPYTLSIVVPKKKAKRGWMEEFQSGSFIETGQELMTSGPKEKTKLLDDVKLAPLLVAALEEVGLGTATKNFGSHDVIVIRGNRTLRSTAEAVGYPCLIDGDALKERAKVAGTYFQGNADLGKSRGIRCRFFAKFCFSATVDKGARNPYAFLHAPYSRRIESLLKKKENGPFHSSDALKLTWRLAMAAILGSDAVRSHWETNHDSIIRRPWAGVPSLLIDGDIAGAFALHVDSGDPDIVTRDLVATKTIPRSAPVVWSREYERIVERDFVEYFGVGVAFYFSFLSFYTRWLVLFAIGGSILAVARRLVGAMPFIVALAISYVTTWTFALLRAWNDRKARLSLRWGLLSMHHKDRQQRPAFFGKPGAVNPVTGTTSVPYFPPGDRRRLHRQNSMMLTLCLLVAIVNVVFCKYLRVFFVTRGWPALPSTIINAVVVFFLNSFVTGVAVFFADRENHEFDDDYDAAIFRAILVFRIVNSFATLFYTAYLKRPLEGRCDKNDDCFKDAGHCAMVFFLVQLTVGNALECLPAYLTYSHVTKAAVDKQKQDTEDPVTPEERDLERAWHQFHLTQAPSIDVLDDYLEIVIQFGYCVLFFVAFPTAPVFALVNNVLEAKIDTVKRISKRRPLPSDSQNVDAYVGAFLFLSILALVNNCALAAFETTDIIQHQLTLVSRLTPMSLFVRALLLNGLLASFISNFDSRGGHGGGSVFPYDVHLQLQRQAYVLSPDSKLVPELYNVSPPPTSSSSSSEQQQHHPTGFFSDFRGSTAFLLRSITHQPR